MNILDKLLQGGIPKKELFIISGPPELVDTFISLYKPWVVSNKEQAEVFIKRLKDRNFNGTTIELDSCTMLKDTIFYDKEFANEAVPTQDDFPYAEDSQDLGPKAEFKKTPLEGLKKKKAVRSAEPSPLLKGLMGTK